MSVAFDTCDFLELAKPRVCACPAIRMLVAVVGVGVAGCAAIKNCLEEGLEVVAFERESAGL